jgi:hypothetical protein
MASRARLRSSAATISFSNSSTPHDSIVTAYAIGNPNFTWSPAS